MSYQPILPLPEPGRYASYELSALSDVWRERRLALDKDGAYVEFIKKLQREWAIETGIIERLYTWDRGVTEILIEQGIEASIISHQAGVSQDEAEHVTMVISDHFSVVEGLFEYIKEHKPLSEHFIRGLQARFTAHQDTTDAITEGGQRVKIPLLKGKYKEQTNNPRRPDGETHEYCPPGLVEDEMQALVGEYNANASKHPPEVRSAWLHHRFTQIHPFQDGNGRVARALASLVFLQEGLFPLVIRESDRTEYIAALEAADNGELGDLIAMFSRRQRDAVFKALGLEQQVQQSRHADQIVSSALAVLKDRFSQEATRRAAAVSAVYDYAERLLADVEARFGDMKKQLDVELRAVTPPGRKDKYHVRCQTAGNSHQHRHYFQKQIVEVANHYDYFANFERYRGWGRLTLSTAQEFDFVVSLHGYGVGESGILAASGFTFIRAPREDGGTEPISVRPTSPDLFQFNYAEQFDSIHARFQEWLESTLTIALAEWKRTL